MFQNSSKHYVLRTFSVVSLSPFETRCCTPASSKIKALSSNVPALRQFSFICFFFLSNSSPTFTELKRALLAIHIFLRSSLSSHSYFHTYDFIEFFSYLLSIRRSVSSRCLPSEYSLAFRLHSPVVSFPIIVVAYSFSIFYCLPLQTLQENSTRLSNQLFL